MAQGRRWPRSERNENSLVPLLAARFKVLREFRPDRCPWRFRLAQFETQQVLQLEALIGRAQPNRGMGAGEVESPVEGLEAEVVLVEHNPDSLVRRVGVLHSLLTQERVRHQRIRAPPHACAFELNLARIGGRPIQPALSPALTLRHDLVRDLVTCRHNLKRPTRRSPPRQTRTFRSALRSSARVEPEARTAPRRDAQRHRLRSGAGTGGSASGASPFRIRAAAVVATLGNRAGPGQAVLTSGFTATGCRCLACLHPGPGTPVAEGWPP